MNWISKGAIVALVLTAVAGVLVVKNLQAPADTEPAAQSAAPTEDAKPPARAALPKLLDLGSVHCVPCKMMEPILAEMEEEYAGALVVEVVDVREQPDVAKERGVRLIPTQVFLDADGAELYRHEGFFSKDEILAKWAELGYDLGPNAE